MGDGLGSARGMVNNSLTPQESRLYTPYGEPTQLSGSAQSAYGFTGEPTDGNALVYLRGRYYHPGIGQFISRDPLETANRYSYVGGNVVNRVDPSGFVSQRMIDVNDGYAVAPTRTNTRNTTSPVRPQTNTQTRTGSAGPTTSTRMIDVNDGYAVLPPGPGWTPTPTSSATRGSAAGSAPAVTINNSGASRGGGGTLTPGSAGAGSTSSSGASTTGSGGVSGKRQSSSSSSQREALGPCDDLIGDPYNYAWCQRLNNLDPCPPGFQRSESVGSCYAINLPYASEGYTYSESDAWSYYWGQISSGALYNNAYRGEFPLDELINAFGGLSDELSTSSSVLSVAAFIAYGAALGALALGAAPLSAGLVAVGGHLSTASALTAVVAGCLFSRWTTD